MDNFNFTIPAQRSKDNHTQLDDFRSAPQIPQTVQVVQVQQGSLYTIIFQPTGNTQRFPNKFIIDNEPDCVVRGVQEATTAFLHIADQINANCDWHGGRAICLGDHQGQKAPELYLTFTGVDNPNITYIMGSLKMRSFTELTRAGAEAKKWVRKNIYGAGNE